MQLIKIIIIITITINTIVSVHLYYLVSESSSSAILGELEV